MKRVISRSGYITIEASLVLPIFIIAMLAIGYYIKAFGIMENVSYTVMDETSKIASRAYVYKSAPMFERNLENRIRRDVPEAEQIKITGIRYLYTDGFNEDLISVKAEYEVDTGLPMGMGHILNVQTKVKCRGFTGAKRSGTPMSFDEMESNGVWDPVWVFPDSGEKYHGKNCSYVVSNAKETVLTGDIKKRYDPCSLCDASTAKAGSFVYCFVETGTVFHLEACSKVTKYTVEINKDQAIQKGYTPCIKCGGE